MYVFKFSEKDNDISKAEYTNVRCSRHKDSTNVYSYNKVLVENCCIIILLNYNRHCSRKLIK